MNAEGVRRYARQIALPEIGPAGQQRLAAARVAVVAHGAALAAETAARYLGAAGVGTLRLIGGAEPSGDTLRASNPDLAVERRAWPADGQGWLTALDGVTLIVRAGFDDDAMLRAAVRLGLPAIVMRADETRGAEVISFRDQGPCPHLTLDVAPQAAAPAPAGAAGVVAGTLAATEALHALLGTGGPSRARHLRLPLDGRDATTQELPWTPECALCRPSAAPGRVPGSLQ
jgi:molybdopterin/thiamine biosynthesis adenylyltransferase